MSNLIVRCSSIGKLMAKPENADLEARFLTPELRAVIAKTKRSDDEKALLDDARRNSLSAGGKTHVRQLLKEAIYGFEPKEIATKPILKGREVEEECIALLAKLTGRPLTKNTERRNNGMISGECDIFDAPIRHGRDVKAAYSMDTMPILLADCFDQDYLYQMQGYMPLWDAEMWSVDYLLVNTPEDLIGYEPAAIHFVDHIKEIHRWTTWQIQRDRAIERAFMDKVSAARRYYTEAANEFDRAHGGKVPELPETAPDLAPWDTPAASKAAAPVAADAGLLLPTF